MKNEIDYKNGKGFEHILFKNGIPKNGKEHKNTILSKLPEVLCITSYPPRECGIATYAQDLINALRAKFTHSFDIKVCAIESETEQFRYTEDVKYILNTSQPEGYPELAKKINSNVNIEVILLQHEFGFFAENESAFLNFLKLLREPLVIVFHTVLPAPGNALREMLQDIVLMADSIIVMTNASKTILIRDYDIPPDKITVIAHGTHLVPHLDQKLLKEKYKLSNRKVVSTFGLLSSGKSIETTLKALPAIVAVNPDLVFLIIGKTHPAIIKREGEKYRIMLEEMVIELKLQTHVQFINYYLPLPVLLEYLQLTDIYLFTSKDPNQAVSGTFSYAISCGCPIISTPIPHAREVLNDSAGIIIDFGDSHQLAKATNSLLKDEMLRKNISSNGLHKMASTAWENAAIAHALIVEKLAGEKLSLRYTIPAVNLAHMKKLTTDFGMLQFSKINQPDERSGYTLDDNARALIAMCQHFEMTLDKDDVKLITIYYNFLKFCLQTEGYFLNYVNIKKEFTHQNNTTNLADANGRAIWALGHLLSMRVLLPDELVSDAEQIMDDALLNVYKIHSTRAMAFVIKGVYYRNSASKVEQNTDLIRQLANRLVQMFKHESTPEWQWFESYLTYANSVLPEAMLCAWLATGDAQYKEIAAASFDFLLSKTFKEKSITIISNKNWLHKINAATSAVSGGEQPIDVAYTILALSKFYDVFENEAYMQKMEIFFNWFLGANHLHQIIYNPCTGGCYDGLEESYVNLNQGAESTISYLMARLTLERSLQSIKRIRMPTVYNFSINNLSLA